MSAGGHKCPDCLQPMTRYGKTRIGSQRYRCGACGRTSVPGYVAGVHTPAWKIDLILSLARMGFSIRRIASITTISPETVHKFTKGIFAICGCGQRAGHKGWCSYLFQQSARRQLTLRTLASPSPNVPGLYQRALCGVCRNPIELAARHRQCIAEARQVPTMQIPTGRDGREITDRLRVESPQDQEHSLIEREAINAVLKRLIADGQSRESAIAMIVQHVDAPWLEMP